MTDNTETYKTIIDVSQDPDDPAFQRVHVSGGAGIYQHYLELHDLANRLNKPVRSMFNKDWLNAYPKGYAVGDKYQLHVTPVHLNKDQDPIIIEYTGPFHDELVMALISRELGSRYIDKLQEMYRIPGGDIAAFISYSNVNFDLSIDQLRVDIAELYDDRVMIHANAVKNWESSNYPMTWPGSWPRHALKFKYGFLNLSSLDRTIQPTVE